MDFGNFWTKAKDFMMPGYQQGANGAMLQKYGGMDMLKDGISIWNMYNQNQFNDQRMKMMEDMLKLNRANYGNQAKTYNTNLWQMYKNADDINGNNSALSRYDQDRLREFY